VNQQHLELVEDRLGGGAGGVGLAAVVVDAAVLPERAAAHILARGQLSSLRHNVLSLIKDGRVHVDAVLSIDRVAEVCVELCNAMVVSLMRL